MAERRTIAVVTRTSVVVVASLLAALVAAVLLVRMAVFMVDVDHKELSIQPASKWRTAHSCLSAYAEGARFAEQPDVNIYEHALYRDRYLSGLQVDIYHYPPPFLLVPGALQHLAGDYLALRPLWFVLQIALILVAALGVARWVGGPEGRWLRYGTAFLFVAPTTLFTLQMGNFQSTALALSLIAMMALTSTRPGVSAFGGIALAYATLSKVFPGVLGIYLLATRRWRAVGWTVAGALVLVGLAAVVYGTRPFDDFINYQMPRLSSGEAFPQSELPRIAALNQSIYGLLVKLRNLGASFLDISTGLRVLSGYGLVLLAAAGFVCWRRRGDVLDATPTRLQTAQLWLALLNLASFRSPFVGGAYGQLGTVWLLILLVVGAASLRERAVWIAGYVAMCTAAIVIPPPTEPPSTAILWFSVAAHVLMVGINIFVIVRAARASR